MPSAMAELRLLPVPEEREGDQEGDADFVFRRIGEAVPLSSPLAPLPSPSSIKKPLAISDRFGALFLVHAQGFMVVRTTAAIDAAKHFKHHPTGGPSLRDLSLVDVPLPAPPSLLHLSPDSSLLAVALAAHIHFFSLPSLLKKDHQTPAFSSALPPSAATVKDFHWLQNAQSYIALSHSGSLYHAHLHGELNHFLDSVHALDSSPDTQSFALVSNNNLSIFSSNLDEQLCLPLSFQSCSDPHNAKVDSIRWVRDDALVVAATLLNDNGDEEGFLVQVITSGATNFFQSSCKPVAFSFPYLFEGILDSILPSGSGPYLLTSYLDRWDLLLTSNKKNIDQHVVLLKWCSNEDGRRVVSLEFLSDKYTPRIDLQENGDDNTIVGFGVEKVSLFEKITIQVGAETQELAPQYIMVCLTCEGKLIMYHIARASDPSELPQSSIADFDLNVTDKNKAATVSKVRTMEPLSVPPDIGEEPKASGENQSEMVSAQVGLMTQPPASSSTTAPLTTAVAESKTLNKIDSPSKEGFGGFSIRSPVFSTGPALSAAIAESKTASETISPLRGTLSSGTQNAAATQPLSLFSTNAAPNTSNQMASSFKGPLNFGTQNAPTALPLGILSASTAPGTTATGSMTMSQITNSFGGAFALGTRNASATQPLGTFSPGATPSITASESKTPGQTSSLKAAFGSAFGSIGSSTQKEESPTTLPQSIKPFSSVSGTVQNEGSLSGSQPLFKPFSGTGLKLRSTGPGSDGISSSKFSEKLPPLSFGIQSKPKRNVEAIPVSSVSLTAVKEGISVTTSEQAQVKTTPGSSMTTRKGETEPEKELANDFYSVRHMTKELDSLFLSIEKEVETTSQHLSLVAVDKHLKRLSESSLICKNNVEEQLQMIQELRDKMSQVSSRQVYMEGIVNQSSDGRYWDVWNCQKLAPEFEQKRQSILKANQNLMTQLVELERHFNTLEINRFGEGGRAGFNRRNVYCHPGSSRQTQSLHSVYNTLNSQLAAAEQLSECLAKQISMLTLSSSSPCPSKNIGSVKKQLFESIGLSCESETYASPDIARQVIDQNSVKRVSTSVKDGRKNSVGLIKGFELETARRRRESLDQNWASVEPQKTTVKRVDQQLQSVKQKRFSIGSDKKFKTNNEIFRKDMEVATICRTSNSTSPVPSLLEPSTTKLNTPILTRGIDKDAPKPTAVPQQSAAFRWAREVSSPFRNLEPKTQASQEKTTRVVQEQPKFTVPSQSLASGTKDANRGGFVSSDTSTLNTPPMTTSLPNVPSVSLNTSTNIEAKGQPVGFSFSRIVRESSSPSFSLFSTSTQSTGSGGMFFSQSESIPSFVAPVQSNTGKEAGKEEPPKEKIPSEIVPTFAPPKPFSSSFESSAPMFSTSTTFGGSKAGTAPLPKKVEESVSVSSLGFSPPKPAQESAAITSSLLQPKPVQESISVLTSTFSPEKQTEKSVSALYTVLSPSKPSSESVSAPAAVVLPPKVVPDALPSSGATLFSSSLTSSKTVATEVPVAQAPAAPPPSSGPALVSSPVQVSIPETASTLITIPSKEITVSTASDKDEDEMEEEAPDSTTDLNLGALGGFGLGSGATPPPQNQSKPNPFGTNLFSANSNPTCSPSLTPSPGSLFRPPSLSFPSSQSVQQPLPLANTSPFAGSGFSGFGQPAQIGAGQQVLGSVLGSFGQSRQFGAGIGHTGSSPSGFGGGFSSAAPTSGGFGGFASAATGGGFASAASGGGFASAATGGGFAGGGFASAATGGGFAGGGFVGAGSGGGFAALASKSGGGFAAAAPGGGGGGFGGGGFGAFGSTTQGSGFLAFSGSGPGRPPAELFSQMRK